MAMAAIIFFKTDTLNTERKMKMPKMKTHRSGAKRYKITASGKIVRRQAGKGHLRANKDVSRKRRLSKMVEISESQVKLVSKELPYKKYSR